jgi:hypothetical protein
VRDDSHVFGQKFPGEKGSVICAKVRGKVFAHFHAVAIKRQVVCRTDCLACQDEFFVDNSLMLKKVMSMLSSLLLTCLAIFGLYEFQLFYSEQNVALPQCYQ